MAAPKIVLLGAGSVIFSLLMGSRRLALQALLRDPTIPSRRVAESVLDDSLAVHAGLLPRFAN